eukprot:m.229346 g.229346  ORF g.229346 m.229346 type:complete len:99 (+) comp18839_c0_seq8:1928-2224(+)
MTVHEASQHNVRLHTNGPEYRQFQDQEGARVSVQGYPGMGTLRFYGPHKLKPGVRCGVELDGPHGKNNGTVGGKIYFECPESHGILVDPLKVTIVERV